MQLLVGGIWSRSEDDAADDPTRGRRVRVAGPVDPWADRTVRAAGSRFTQTIRASRELLASRSGHRSKQW